MGFEDYMRDPNAEAGVARQKLDGLPILLDLTAYRLSQIPDDTSSSNLNDKLSLVTSRISDIDAKLQSSSELRQVAAQVDSLRTVAAVLGLNETASLKQKLEQIDGAERMRANLVQTQQALQTRVAEVRADAVSRLAAVAAQRQSYAEDLTRTMAGEVRWCATGQDNEVLAGAVTANRLSDNTYSQLGSGSPLWKQMFAKGFRFRAVQDRNGSLKVAAIRAEGGYSVAVTTLPEVDRISLEQAIPRLSSGRG